ncbi:hypothetical protein HNY73_019137 [Argiope bruennichi]|uniref:Uncharacterized protein n=1 Tax=Argiope bruennichi TaxID=94029 RepID=A0A8T0EF67_ARGBR|nr:hypothetical protein HNY73_019137 [Argiope bruennichi]
MTSSPEIYVSYIFFMVSTTIQTLPNRLESFVTTCSLATAVAAYVYDKGYLEFLDYSPTILMVLFEKFYVEKSGTFQLWNHLHEHFIINNYSKAYEIVEEKTDGNPFADVIYNKHFVREISFLIKSDISVSKHAAVYCQTQEVMERFIKQTGSKVVSTRNMSTQTEQSLQENLIEYDQSISEEDPGDFSRKRTALTRLGKEPLQEINKPTIVDSEDSISRGKKIEVIISNRNALQKDLNEQSTSEKDTEDTILKINSLFQSEKQSLQEINKPRTLDSDSRGKNIEVIVSNRRSLFQSLQKFMKQLIELESQQSIFVEGTENNNLKISSSQLEELSLRDKGKQLISEEGTVNKREDAEFVNAKRSSSWKLDKALHNDVKKRKRSLSEKICNGDKGTNSNRISLFQLEQYLEILRMQRIAEIKRNRGIFVEETEIFRSKISPPQLAEQSVQNTEKPTMSVKGQNTSSKDTETSDLGLTSSSYSENPLPRCEEVPRILESEQSSDRDEDISFNHISVTELEQTSPHSTSESKVEISAEEAIDLTIPIHSKEQTFQNLEKSGISNSEEIPFMIEDNESVISECEFSLLEQSLQEDFASEQNISEMQNGGNAVKQVALSESEEKTLQDDIKELSESENEQGMFGKSSSAIRLSEEDDTWPFETKRIEGNCSDSIQYDDTRASSLNSVPRIKRKKKKVKSKSKQPKATELDTTLQVPSKKEALCALLFLMQKLNDSLETIYALLDISRNN